MFSIKENVEMEIKNGKRRLVGFIDIRRLHKDMKKLEGNYSGLSSFKGPMPFPVNSSSLSIPAIRLHITASLCHPQINLLQSRNQYTGMI